MSNNRPVSKPAEHELSGPAITTSKEETSPTLAASANKDATSTTRMLSREAGRIAVVGAGVAGALYPLDIAMHHLHTRNNQTSSSTGATPSSPTSRTTRIPSIPLATARAFAKGYFSSAQLSMIKNGTLTQRSKLLNPEKAVIEENIASEEFRSEEFEEGSASSIPLTRVAFVSGLIGMADTTLTQYHANQRTLALQGLLTKQPTPKPNTPINHLKLYAAGYPVRLTRNVALVGGLLTSSIFDDWLKTNSAMPANQRTLIAATLTGATVGIGSNALDIIYKAQLTKIKPDFSTVSAYGTMKNLVKEQGGKALTRGYGVSVLYTVVAYNVVPYMEELSKQAVPAIERQIDSAAHFVMSFFNKDKTATRAALPSTKPAPEAPTAPTVETPRLQKK